jgi:hypothetical protein
MNFIIFSVFCASIWFFFWGIGKLIERHNEKEKHKKPKILGH